MIDIRGLTKRYGAQEVLRGLDLRVARGRVTAIVGPNGTGKTTLIKTILGLVRADAGEVLVNGIPVSEDGAYRARIGYMPQIARFPQNLSGRELLAMLRDLRGGAAAVAIDAELIGAFQLDGELDKRVGTLSGGTRQKLNAVMAFLFAPELLILDEPTAGLDPVASGTLKDRILAERAAGTTLILSSHYMSELEELADDVVVLAEGTVCYSGSLDALMRRTREANLGRAIAHLMTRATAA